MSASTVHTSKFGYRLSRITSVGNGRSQGGTQNKVLEGNKLLVGSGG